jgi:preprotein translocase subunit SecG
MAQNENNNSRVWTVLALLLAIAALVMAYMALNKASDAMKQVEEVEKLQREEDIKETNNAPTPQSNEGMGADGTLVPDSTITR